MDMRAGTSRLSYFIISGMSFGGLRVDIKLMDLELRDLNLMFDDTAPLPYSWWGYFGYWFRHEGRWYSWECDEKAHTGSVK